MVELFVCLGVPSMLCRPAVAATGREHLIAMSPLDGLSRAGGEQWNKRVEYFSKYNYRYTKDGPITAIHQTRWAFVLWQTDNMLGIGPEHISWRRREMPQQQP